MATRGGARCLGRDDIGSLEPGKAADLILVDTRRLSYAGAGSDPLAALVFIALAGARGHGHGERPRGGRGRTSSLGVDVPALVERADAHRGGPAARAPPRATGRDYFGRTDGRGADAA